VIRTLEPRGSIDRPTYQWEPARGRGPAVLRLFGILGQRELARVLDALLTRCPSPRDLVCIDFEEVDHLDYRALPEFANVLFAQRDRGSSIWLVGLSPYLRALFQVAGQGPVLGRLEWRDPEDGTGQQERDLVRLGSGSERLVPDWSGTGA
jgi:ABC-type transporter Mla MlaB component